MNTKKLSFRLGLVRVPKLRQRQPKKTEWRDTLSLECQVLILAIFAGPVLSHFRPALVAELRARRQLLLAVRTLGWYLRCAALAAELRTCLQ